MLYFKSTTKSCWHTKIVQEEQALMKRRVRQLRSKIKYHLYGKKWAKIRLKSLTYTQIILIKILKQSSLVKIMVQI